MNTFFLDNKQRLHHLTRAFYMIGLTFNCRLVFIFKKKADNVTHRSKVHLHLINTIFFSLTIHRNIITKWYVDFEYTKHDFVSHFCCIRFQNMNINFKLWTLVGCRYTKDTEINYTKSILLNILKWFGKMWRLCHKLPELKIRSFDCKIIFKW